MSRSGHSVAGCPVNAMMLLLSLMLTAAVLIALLSAGVTAAAVTGEFPISDEQAEDIATVVSVPPDEPQLAILRQFRDAVLLTNPVGTFLWTTYATVSPPIADALLAREHLRVATRLLLLTPVVYLAALCLNTIALLAFIVLILLVLVILRRHLKTVFKGVLYGLLASAAFVVASITLGALGYELPVCAVVAAYLLPVITPVGLAVCVITWIESPARPRPRPRPKPRLY
ncbi:MAG: CFI-box-CTERM domain-containing protein [Candidatus Methanospirareceae archaeon]